MRRHTGHAELFQRGERQRHSPEVHSRKQHECAREEIEESLRRKHRCGVGGGAAERARDGSGGGIARDAAGVEGELALPDFVLVQQRERGGYAAAHAGTVQARSEAAERERERQGEFAHITFE